MSAYLKGDRSKEEIIDKSRELFNEYGLQLTLAKLAELMGTTLGRITHHFKNKDLLFVAITQDYELRLNELRKNRPQGPASMDNFIKGSAHVMDLQYDFRCAMRYTVASFQHINEINSHVQTTYSSNRAFIKNTIQAYVDSGSLHPRILQDDIYEVFLFQLTNLFTNWVVNLELYDYDKTYHEVKPIYLKGIVSVFLPFLTEKGQQEVDVNGIFRN
jgi:AcrR family transcriptional regulator